MINATKTFFAIALLSTTCTTALGADKSQYHIFNPTPRDEMREMVSDQTLFTYTPFTVDAGHFQIEADIVDYYYDHFKKGGQDIKTEGWSFGLMTLKAGLCDRADLQLSFSPLYEEFTTRDRVAGTRTKDSGFGDITLGSKINLWGNDGGNTALALVPYVTFPTAYYNNEYAGGIDVPFTIQMPWKVRLGLLSGIEFYDNAANDLHARFYNGISLRRPVAFEDRLDLYAEFFTGIREEDGDWFGLVNAGVAFQLTKNTEIHLGSAFGVKNTDDFNPYIGFSWRH